jgi:transcriptional regulator GlxA family with amidase domain
MSADTGILVFNDETTHLPTDHRSGKPVHYGLLVFPGFQALDAYGPLDSFNMLSRNHDISLSIIAQTLDPVSTRAGPSVLKQLNIASSRFSESIVPTHTFSSPPEQLDVLIIPGGFGLRAPDPELDGAINYIRDVYPRLKYALTVCTGSVLLARTGILDGRKATTNKRSWGWAVPQGPKVDWVPVARWVVDGNIWTASGVAAGMDATLAFIEKLYGKETAEDIANTVEYERHEDPAWDPFAKVWKVPGA